MAEIRTRQGRTAPALPPNARFTLVVTTARAEPRLDWLIDGLEAQATPSDEVELIVVDTRGRPAEAIGYRPIAPIIRLIETCPKPTPWQGSQRVTTRDFWAASNARNTGIVLASQDYIVFLDDRCRLGTAWLARVRQGVARPDSVLAGAYDQIDDPPIWDHRIRVAPRGRRNCQGGWLYGGNFALPLAWLLEVNGLEEGMDGLAGEDCVLGRMLKNRGRRIDFSTEMYLQKERPAGTHHGLTGRRTIDDTTRAQAALARFGRRTRTEFTPDLTELRANLARGERFPDVDPDAPHLDWYDGQPIRASV